MGEHGVMLVAADSCTQVAAQLQKITGSNKELKTYGAGVYQWLQDDTNKLQVQLRNALMCIALSKLGMNDPQPLWKCHCLLGRSRFPNSHH